MGAKDDPCVDQDADLSPGAITETVTAELTARKYAGQQDLRPWCRRTGGMLGG